MKQTKWILSALLIAITTTAMAADPVKGNGKPVTKTIEVGDYNEIRINGIMEFNYEQTEVPTSEVVITLDENLFTYLHTEVKDRILTIRFKDAKVDQVTRFTVKANSQWLKAARVEGNANFITHTPVNGDELEIRANANSLVQLKEPITTGVLKLKMNGSANIVAEKLKVEKLECDLDGSGSVTIRNGKALTGLYSIVGGSDLHAYDIQVDELNCRMTGSGVAEVHALTKLKASIMGKGEIRYKGSPEVQQSIIGKGKIINAN